MDSDSWSMAGGSRGAANCSSRAGMLAGRDPTAWLGWEDSNSEMFAKYPFERSHRFPVNPAKSDDRDYSRLSCGVGRRSSGLAPGCLRWQELPRFSADAEMIRRQPIQQYYALHGRLLLQRERLWW